MVRGFKHVLDVWALSARRAQIVDIKNGKVRPLSEDRAPLEWKRLVGCAFESATGRGVVRSVSCCLVVLVVDQLPLY